MKMVSRLSVAFQSDKTMAEYSELGALVEAYGFGTVSVYSDLMYQPALPALLSIAAATDRIRLGPACLNPFMLHPVEIAGQAAVLDAASNGRSYLGLARGAWLDSLGIATQHPVARIRETVEVAQHLWKRADEPYPGQHYSLEANHQLRYPIHRPEIPILIGTWSPRLAHVAGELASEVKIGGSANPDMVGVMRTWIGKGAQASHRNAEDVGIVLGAVTVVDEDGDRARALARRELALYLPIVLPLDSTYRGDPERLSRIQVAVRQNDIEAASALLTDDIVGRFAFAGTPSDLIEQVEEVFSAGASRVEFGTPHGLNARKGLDLLGTRVLPYFAESEEVTEVSHS